MKNILSLTSEEVCGKEKEYFSWEEGYLDFGETFLENDSFTLNGWMMVESSKC